MWCLAAGQESIPETRFFLLPDKDNLKKHKINAHHEYIQPTLKAAAAAPVNPAKTVEVLRKFGATMERSSKAAEAQNATQQEQLAYLMEKDNKKKNKVEKWHGLSQRLILNAASTDRHVPTEEIPVFYQDIINSKMAAMADKELHSQMVALDHPHVGFAHGTATSLYNGSILWHRRDKQSNLSFFTLSKTTPSWKPKPCATSV
jgi:hypothetical protein